MNQINIDFISRVLPGTGWICVAQLLKGGGFKHYWYQSLEDAIARLEGLDNKGHNAYLAQSTFRTDESRKQDNVDAVQSCWFDIDCGPTKPFATQRDGAEALLDFCAECNLPIPTIISSGNGLYAHWIFAEALPGGLWRNTAKMLKDLTVQRGFAVDQSRTADTSSVLRPPGVRNWKDSNNPKDVRILRGSTDVHHNEFHSLLVKALGIRATPSRVTHHNIADEFAVAVTGPPADADKVADKCMQMNMMRSTGGNMAEPLWYAMLCILRHCENGRDKAHEWSQGHTGYSAEETDRKLDQSDTGPSTCLYIASHNPEGCISCRFQGKITSPINLGKPEPKELVPVGEDSPYPEPPLGYRVADDGVFRRTEGEWELVYKYPLYVEALVADMNLGYEVAVLRHRDSQGKWQEVHLRSALIHDKKQLLMAMHDQHLQSPTGDMEKLFMFYITSAIQKMRDSTTMQIASQQMGWKNPTHPGEQHTFILGSEMFHQDGTTQAFKFSRTTPEVVKAYHAKGEMEMWVRATRFFGAVGMEAQAFAFIAAAFGAPLMKWTGFHGALISIVGKSGVGKSLTGNMVLSVYGDPSKLMMLRDDTKNGMVSRLGVYGSTPFYVDEVSNMPGEELSDFAYRVTQGRDKVRLTKNSTEKAAVNEWNTIALASSNHSVVERLASHKADASAEFNRVIEYNVSNEFAKADATEIYRAAKDHYGHAGRAYAKYLTENQGDLTSKLDTLIAEVDRLTAATTDERYWSAVAACAIYGGLIAKKLGLIMFDPAAMIPWIITTIKSMRVSKLDNVTDSFSILANIMDRYMGNTIVVSEFRKNSIIDPWVPVRGRIEARIEINNGEYWINKQLLKEELQKRHFSYSKFMADLKPCIIDAHERMQLGKGTYYSTSRQPCVRFSLADTNLCEGLISKVEMSGRLGYDENAAA